MVRERRKHKAQEGNQRVDSFKEEKSMVSCATERSSCRKTGKCGRRKNPWTIIPECDLYSISYLHIWHFDIALCMKTETVLQRLECMLAWRGPGLIIARMLIPPWLFLYNHTLIVVENNFQKDEIMTVMQTYYEYISKILFSSLYKEETTKMLKLLQMNRDLYSLLMKFISMAKTNITIIASDRN